MDASSLAIGRVTLRGADAAIPAVRLRAASELQAADLIPPGLPPASVLVVRKLSDPLPRRFGARQWRPSREWEHAVRAAIRDAAMSAARPDERGRIDATVAAVLFEDEAQLIACLIADRAGGRIQSHWWWTSVFRRLDLPFDVVFDAGRDPGAILSRRAREAPAALSLIAKWGEAVSLAEALSPGSARNVLRAVALAHDLPSSLVTSAGNEEQDPAAEDRIGISDSQPSQQRRRADVSVWERWLPADIRRAGLDVAIRRLFGIAIGLQTAPAAVRAQAVASTRANALEKPRASASRLSQPQHVRVTPSLNETPTIPGREEQRDEATTGSLHRARQLDRAASAATIGTPGPSRELRPEPNRQQRDVPGTSRIEPQPHVNDLEIASERVTPRTDFECAPGGNVDHGSAAPAPGHDVRLRDQHDDAENDTAAALAPRPNALASQGVPTRLGGAFYLIHVLQRLEIPDAFSAAWRLSSDAGVWGTLDLITRALMGRSLRKRDRLWSTLAHLAGRTGSRHRPFQSSIEAGQSDPAWRAPQHWMDELGDDAAGPLAWTRVGSRIWMWSNAGYVVSHRRSGGAHPETVALAHGFHAIEERPAHEIPWMPPAALPDGCPPRLGRWAAATAPAVLRRLQLALDVDRSRALRTLRVPARVYVTSSHVDVVFPMSNADLRVRRAGLDRNPGWLPAAGRVIYFHFE